LTLRQNGHWNGREFGATRVLPKIKKQKETSEVQDAMWGCVLASVPKLFTPNCTAEDNTQT
jgi:alkyl hydroperoxide reductase subunit AhpC